MAFYKRTDLGGGLPALDQLPSMRQQPVKVFKSDEFSASVARILPNITSTTPAILRPVSVGDPYFTTYDRIGEPLVRPLGRQSSYRFAYLQANTPENRLILTMPLSTRSAGHSARHQQCFPG
jgi:hypothetical protein